MEKLTNPSEITENTLLLIENLRTSLLDLNEFCIDYIELYEQYANNNIYDTTLLKERMKSAIIKAVPDDVI